MRLRIHSCTHPGLVRTRNEDACSADMLDPRENAALLIVADGMGGYEGGEVASRLAVDTVRARVAAWAATWAERDWLGEGLAEAITAANQAILQAQHERPEFRSMGTTTTAALVWGERAYIGHIGDSKVYLVGKNDARQLTTDHNLAGELLQSGHLTADQAAVHPQRNLLTRALGIGDTIMVERHDTLWNNSDLLLLGTDGLSNLVRLCEIQELADQVEFAALPERLVALALERGGHDNITVLIARWEG